MSSSGNAKTSKKKRDGAARTATFHSHRGGQVLPLLFPAEVAALTTALAKQKRGQSQSITTALGNGCGPAQYATLQEPLPELLANVMAATRRWVVKHAKDEEDEEGKTKKKKTKKKKTELLGKKALLLEYGLGSRNYAHKDVCGDYQALLMLSTPGVDYTGGTFFVVNSDEAPPALVTEFPFTAAGEIIVFRGGGACMHGMTELFKGTAEETKRIGVGLFQ